MSEENKSNSPWPAVLMVCGLVAAGALIDFRPGIKYLLFLSAIVGFLHIVWESRNPLKNLLKKKQYRSWHVLAWTAVGALGGRYFVYLLETSTSGFFYTIKCEYERLIAPIFLLIVSAPVSFYLWTCRNADKLQQIEQTEEQNRLNSFSNAMRLFFEKDNKHANATGLRILAKIRKKSDAFRTEIDMATPGVDLEEGDLTAANLTSIDLSRATLTKAKLPNANLTGANLTGASMLGVDLTGANLKDAILNDIVVGINKKDVYKETYDNKFSRTAIEFYLKDDWKNYETIAQVKEKSENNQIYYYFKELVKPISSASTSGAPDAGPNQPPPAPIEPSRSFAGQEIDTKGARQQAPAHAFGDTMRTPQRKAAEERCERGLAKMEKGDYDGAISDFDEAIELDPSYAIAYRYRGAARLHKRRREEGEK